MLQVDAMPTCGRSKSDSANPTARNIARLGACSTPSTTIREYRRSSLSSIVIVALPDTVVLLSSFFCQPCSIVILDDNFDLAIDVGLRRTIGRAEFQ